MFDISLISGRVFSMKGDPACRRRAAVKCGRASWREPRRFRVPPIDRDQGATLAKHDLHLERGTASNQRPGVLAEYHRSARDHRASSTRKGAAPGTYRGRAANYFSGFDDLTKITIRSDGQ